MVGRERSPEAGAGRCDSWKEQFASLDTSHLSCFLIHKRKWPRPPCYLTGMTSGSRQIMDVEEFETSKILWKRWFKIQEGKGNDRKGALGS